MAKQAEFHIIEDLFDLYCTVGDELYAIAKRVEDKDPELHFELRKVCSLLNCKGEAAYGLMCEFGEEINRLRRDVLGDTTDFFVMEEV